MKKHTYSLIALAVIAVPFGFSFDPRLHFWTHWLAVLASIIVVGFLFVVWDILVVKKGHWQFNPVWTGDWTLGGLPLGEYLFFIAVPYAMLFSYEAFRTLWSDRLLFDMPPGTLLALSAVFVAGAAIWHRQGYTLLALTAAAVFFATTALERPALIGTQGFLLYILLGFGAFGVVNGLYTSLPTIFYAKNAIWGVRIGTIPLEDFFYNMSYLGLILDFYLIFSGLLPTL